MKVQVHHPDVGGQALIIGFLDERKKPYEGMLPLGLVTSDKDLTVTGLKKNLANKIFGYLARCEFLLKLGL